jgi:hypothetical protein
MTERVELIKDANKAAKTRPRPAILVANRDAPSKGQDNRRSAKMNRVMFAEAFRVIAKGKDLEKALRLAREHICANPPSEKAMGSFRQRLLLTGKGKTRLLPLFEKQDPAHVASQALLSRDPRVNDPITPSYGSTRGAEQEND